MLKYSLVENLLTERPDDYSAQVHSSAAFDKDALVDRMLQRGSLVTKTDIVAVLNNLEETVADIVKDGGTVSFPLFNLSYSISGVFEGATDSFDPNRHKLNVNLSKGTVLRAAEKTVATEKVQSSTANISILEVKDCMSNRSNEVLTSGGVVEIRGVNIKVEGDDAECGVWFVPEAGEPVKSAVLISNKPSAVIATIPQLAAGKYSIRISTQCSVGSILKKVKHALYLKQLNVE